MDCKLSADNFRDTRHFANTLFNIMRGGIFDKKLPNRAMGF